MEAYPLFPCMPSWPDQGKVDFFFGNVCPYLRQMRRWTVGGMGSKLLKGRGRDCNQLLFRNFFVGTEKNHENIGIAGDLVEFWPTYKFKALPLQQPARTEVTLFCAQYTASETCGNFAQWVFIKRKVFSSAKDVLYVWICSYRLRGSTRYMSNTQLRCMTSGFCREVAENCALLGYYATSSGNFLPLFRDDSWTMRMGPIGLPETSVRNYHYSLHHNP